MWILALTLSLTSQPRVCTHQDEVVSSRQPVAQGPASPNTAVRGGQVFELHDIRDLLESLPNEFDTPELGVVLDPPRVGPSIAAPAPRESVTPAPRKRTDEELARAAAIFEDLAKTYCTPPLGPSSETLQVTRSGTIAANLLPEQQAWLEDFLTLQRDFRGFAKVQGSLYHTPRGFLKKWKVEPYAVLPTAADRDALLARLAAAREAEWITTQTLTSPPNLRTNISVLNSISFVSDWTVHLVEPNQTEIADPEIGVIHEGVVLEVRPTPLRDGLLGLSFQFVHSKIERPIRTVKATVGSRTPREVELTLPSAHTVRLRGVVKLADGASVVLIAPALDEAMTEIDLVLIVTASRVSELPRLHSHPSGDDKK
jgi:hypothetical protein